MFHKSQVIACYNLDEWQQLMTFLDAEGYTWCTGMAPFAFTPFEALKAGVAYCCISTQSDFFVRDPLNIDDADMAGFEESESFQDWCLEHIANFAVNIHIEDLI